MKDHNTFLLNILTEKEKAALSWTFTPNEASAVLKSAETLLLEKQECRLNNSDWHRYLDITGKQGFLYSLKNRKERCRWAETSFKAILRSDYSLETMFMQRVASHPEKVLFKEYWGDNSILWTYEKVYDRIRKIAAAFYRTGKKKPRVALFTANNAFGACCDLACLTYDIFVTPLNIHFDIPTLKWIFERLDITILITDSEERYSVLKSIRKEMKKKFRIYCLDEQSFFVRGEDKSLSEEYSDISSGQINKILSARRKFAPGETSTVLFTSGSTGVPKGVCFSNFNLISKRFARAAALPDVGNNEVLLCYLPLFHTFGRYLEMMGTVYWGGTYVFIGNPSPETLMVRLKQVQPTGLISIPLRWIQIREQCLKIAGDTPTMEAEAEAFRSVTGNRLRWGLSAAGYLDPRVFHFFQRNGVDLCSGFGMTEATGGITMTPPGEYRDNSVGIPLPGVKTRVTGTGELQLAGPYIASYLPDDKADGLPVQDLKYRYWLPTGDLFEKIEKGHLQIVDRIKDIYKNNRGQTVAPKKVEQKFEGVPGIKRTFLVGDGRAYNVLLIVPDFTDPVLQAFTTEESRRTYFNNIVTVANQECAPFERVVNFTLLNRDFTLEDGELTPKGSYRRKVIEEHFSESIESLYSGKYFKFIHEGYTVLVPRWFYRDLGTLEGDIVLKKGGLYNRNTKRLLKIRFVKRDRAVLIGSFEYKIKDKLIDLGVFARQPRLWIGNPDLIAFSPVKEGWDLPFESISIQTLLPKRTLYSFREYELLKSFSFYNTPLQLLNENIIKALFTDKDIAIDAIENLEMMLKDSDNRTIQIIRRRMEMLARHPEEDIRCLAYRILLLDNPMTDYSVVFPAFIASGLSFLNEESINHIANASFEKIRLESLRKRLYQYRTYLDWPVPAKTKKQFQDMLELIVNFAKKNPQYYAPVRAELSAWSMLKKDEKISSIAKKFLFKLVDWYEELLKSQLPPLPEEEWESKIVFDDRITGYEIKKLKKVLINTTFISQSIILAFDVRTFNMNNVKPGGIWISRILSRRNHHSYRMSINTVNGKHYDLLMILSERSSRSRVMETSLWLISLSLHATGQYILPRFGCYRPELGALSLVFYSDLTVWERIREISGIRHTQINYPDPYIIRKMYVSAFGAFFQGWINSSYRIVPGAVFPTNIVVPEPDFRESAKIHSLAHLTQYTGTLSIVYPMLHNFYRKTKAHYPWTEAFLKYSWIFDACIEKLGQEKGIEFLMELQNDLSGESLPEDLSGIRTELKEYLSSIVAKYYIPLPLLNAVSRYREWEEVNGKATVSAKISILQELYKLYNLNRYPEIARYHFYRRTYFRDTDARLGAAFDSLLENLFQHPELSAVQMIELSDLQAMIKSKKDRQVFNTMVFLKYAGAADINIITVGDRMQKQVIVQSVIHDKSGSEFVMRNPVDPAEIGELYRLFYRDHYPKTVSEQDHYFVVLDLQEQIVAGVIYRMEEKNIIHLDGIVVSAPLKGRGLSQEVLKDFCSRMEVLGIRYIKTHFFRRQFYLNNGFTVNKRWGGLVKFLKKPENLSPVPVIH